MCFIWQSAPKNLKLVDTSKGCICFFFVVALLHMETTKSTAQILDTHTHMHNLHTLTHKSIDVPCHKSFSSFFLPRKCIACKRTSLFDRLKRRFYSILLKFAECSFHSYFTCKIRDVLTTYYVYDFHFLFYGW